MKPEILIIDDEEEILRLLEISLQNNEFKVVKALRGREGLIMASNHPPALILLDLGLPDMSGHDVLKNLRNWYTNPILILSVQNSEEDIVRALDNGANDYLVKPFRTAELLARIRSALRAIVKDQRNSQIRFGNVTVDLKNRSVKIEDEIIKLTPIEYNLLQLLVINEGKVLTHQYLLKQIWGPGFINQSQYLRVYVAQLRKKLEPDPNNPVHILTESRVGYRFIA
jgi:two-component system KDP operon response regulator KdpE